MAKRITYGNTPWGAYFVSILEQSNDQGRLDRGKSYANTGRVADFHLSGPKVSAKVEGNYQPWYHVSLEFPPFTPREEGEVRRIILGDPAMQVGLALGEIPPGFMDALKEAGIALLPENWKTLRRSCSCPDSGNPCKHMAALYYMMAREIDQNPKGIFRLRGMDLDKVLPGDPGLVLPPVWTPVPRSRDFAPPEQVPDYRIKDAWQGLVLSLLRPAPAFYAAGDFKVMLSEFYHHSARHRDAVLTLERVHPFSAHPRGRQDGLRWLTEAAYSLHLDQGKSGSLEQAKVRLSHPLGGTEDHGILDLVPAFLALDDHRGNPGCRFFFHASRLFWQLAQAGALTPVPAEVPGGLVLYWKPLSSMAGISKQIAPLAELVPPLLALDGGSTADGQSTLDLVLTGMATAYVHALDFKAGSGRSTDPVCQAFFQGKVLDTGDNAYKSSPRAIQSWLAILDQRPGAYRYRFVLSAAPGLAQAAEAEAVPDYVLETDIAPTGTEDWRPLSQAKTLPDPTQALGFAAMLGSFLPELARLQRQDRVILDQGRLGSFLGDAAPALRRLDVQVLLPKELARELKPRLSAQAPTKKTGGNLESSFGLEQLCDYQWTVCIGDRRFTPKEFEALIKKSITMVQTKDGFAFLDPLEMQRLLDQSRRAPGASDVVASYLEEPGNLDARARQNLDQLFRQKETALPAGLTATLRHYQGTGFSWAWNNLQNGFGCLLADDMGLGKTIQAISIILKTKEEGLLEGGCMVAAPASLLTNWQRELARFAPGLEVQVYYGPRRKLAQGKDVYLSTYETLNRDQEKLGEHEFALLVLDEAHGLKNAGTKRAQAIRNLKTRRRLALTGTPVENRLEDLRAIFDLVLPGYLGEARDFKNRWRIPIELHRDADSALALKRITSPFLLRRLKTDSGIAPELPPKTVIDEYASLSLEQAALYQTVLSELAGNPHAFEDDKTRSALVLKLLTALKQVCNHPRAYDGQSPVKAELSGKAQLLLELLGSIMEAGEKVLVFSQYVGTLELLRELIESNLGESCLLLHGSMGQEARSRAVDLFQNDPARRIFLISLKAGGVGLNLTAASRVIHYDLWYNPAVENQASDRAFRIGQTRQVFVHRLICAGTFEEKIDAMIKAKQALADMTVASGESWLADLAPEELYELFKG